MSIQYIQNATGATLSASVQQQSSLQWQCCTLTTKLLLHQLSLLNLSGELHCLQFAAVNCIALLVYVAQKRAGHQGTASWQLQSDLLQSFLLMLLLLVLLLW